MNKDILLARFAVVVIFLVTVKNNSCAQPGQYDLTFSEDGKVFTGDPAASMIPFASAIQTDGKLLLAGSGGSDCIIIRYNENGTQDNTFASGGKVVTDFGKDLERFFAIAIQQDGKILAAGSNDFYGNNQKGVLARYHSNGALDSSFGINGKVITNYNTGPGGTAEITSINLLPDGKILTGGGRSFDVGGLKSEVVAKYNINGSLDSSFGIDGLFFLDKEQNFALQDDGKLIFAGYRSIASVNNLELTRYLPNGSLDLSFNGKGYVDTMVDSIGINGGAIKILPDDKIMIEGIVYKGAGVDLVLLQYNNNGTIDTSFGIRGISKTSFSERMNPSVFALQADGKILVAGTEFNTPFIDGGVYMLLRYLSNGLLDSAFADNGKKIYDDVNTFQGGCSGMLLKNHRIYLCGWYDNGFALGFNIFAIQNDGSPFSAHSIDLCPGAGSIVLSTDLVGAAYQWQLSTDGIVYNNISNTGNYSGVASATLFLHNIPSSWSGYRYRCLAGSGISEVFTIRFLSTWTGEFNNAWEQPLNWSCNTLPDGNTDVMVKSGSVFVNTNSSARSITAKAGASITVQPGNTLTVTH